MTVSSAFVPRFLTVTLAFGTAAPLESSTVPPMAPSVVDCAKVEQANNAVTIRTRQYRTMEVSIPLVLIDVSPFIGDASRTHTQTQSPPGWSGGLPTFWGRIAVTANADCRQQPASRFMAYLVSQELCALKQNLWKTSVHPKQ